MENFEPSFSFEDQFGDVLEADVLATLSEEAANYSYNQQQSHWGIGWLSPPPRVDATRGCIVADVEDEIDYRVLITNISSADRVIDLALDFGKCQRIILDPDYIPKVEVGFPAQSPYLSADFESAKSAGPDVHRLKAQIEVPAGMRAEVKIRTKLDSAPKDSFLRGKIPIMMTLADGETEASGTIHQIETVAFWSRGSIVVAFVLVALGPLVTVLFAPSEDESEYS